MPRNPNDLQLARQRAYRKLAAMHRDEFADLLASERIRLGFPGDTTNTRSPLQRARCGTRSGYNRHLRRGEAGCEPCQEAMREYARRRAEGSAGRMPAG